MEMPSALKTIQYTLSILLYALHAAIVSVPSALTLLWMMILETEYITDCSPAGKPIWTIRFTIKGLSRMFLKISL